MLKKTMRKNIFGFIVAWLFTCSFTGNVAAEILVEDYYGNKIKLDEPARRIVALAPHIVENAFSAGIGEYLVGVVDYSDYPPAAKKISHVGGYSSFSLETIIARNPDLVLVWPSGNGNEIVTQLRALGLPVYLDNPKTLDDVAKALRDYARLGGKDTVGEQAAQNYLHKLNSLRRQYMSATPVSVFYQVWNQPLQTLNGEHIISDVIRLCGGRNIFADSPVTAPKINIESVLEANPEVIVASGMGESRPEWLDDWKRFSHLQAVRENNLFHVPPDILQRHTIRILAGARLMCEHLQSTRG